jgi:lipopolysaccharide transport system permease protein
MWRRSGRSRSVSAWASIHYLDPAMSAHDTASAAPERMITIRPPTRWPGLGLRELWDARELLYFMAKREVQIRYKQSVIGVGWAVLQPLGIAFIFALLFGTVLSIPSDGIVYPVFAIVGIVPWMFASQLMSHGAQSLVFDAPLLSKVYFPRLTLPLAKGLGLGLDLAIAFVVMIAVVLVYGVGLTAHALIAPGFLLLDAVAAFSLATLFAAINVKYRDMIVVVPILVQLLLFLSPLVYSATQIKGDWIYLYSVNPFASVITGMRWSLAGGPAPDAGAVLVSVASALVLFSVAILYFRRAEREFADVV